MTERDKIKHQKAYEEHLIGKQQARASRSKGKEKSRKDECLLYFNFALKAALNTPKEPAGQILTEMGCLQFNNM